MSKVALFDPQSGTFQITNKRVENFACFLCEKYSLSYKIHVWVLRYLLMIFQDTNNSFCDFCFLFFDDHSFCYQDVEQMIKVGYYIKKRGIYFY